MQMISFSVCLFFPLLFKKNKTQTSFVHIKITIRCHSYCTINNILKYINIIIIIIFFLKVSNFFKPALKTFLKIMLTLSVVIFFLIYVQLFLYSLIVSQIRINFQK